MASHNSGPDEEPLESDVLHVAATRPAMFMGLPFTTIVAVGVVVLEIETALGLKMALVLGIPLVLTAYLIVRHDYNAPNIWYLWSITRLPMWDDWHWGGTCATSFPIKPPKIRPSLRTFRLRLRGLPRGVPRNAW
jgi:type IV secretion system protein VirB3